MEQQHDDSFPSRKTTPRFNLPTGDARKRDHSTAVGENAAIDIKKAVEDVTASVEQLYRIGDAFIGHQAEERPYVVLGAAAGVGFVLGGGLASRIGGVLMSYVARVAVLSAMKSVATAVSDAPVAIPTP